MSTNIIGTNLIQIEIKQVVTLLRQYKLININNRSSTIMNISTSPPRGAADTKSCRPRG